MLNRATNLLKHAARQVDDATNEVSLVQRRPNGASRFPETTVAAEDELTISDHGVLRLKGGLPSIIPSDFSVIRIARR